MHYSIIAIGSLLIAHTVASPLATLGKRNITVNQAPPSVVLSQLAASPSEEGSLTRRQDDTADDPDDTCGTSCAPLSPSASAQVNAQLLNMTSADNLTTSQINDLFTASKKRSIGYGPEKEKRTPQHEPGKLIYGLEGVPDHVKRDILAAEKRLVEAEAEKRSWSHFVRRSLSLNKRSDHRKDCGSGNGAWVPVDQWQIGYAAFCSLATGPNVDVPAGEGSGTSNNGDEKQSVGWITMPSNTTLTTQNANDKKNGVVTPGNIWCKFLQSWFKKLLLIGFRVR